MSGKSLEKLKEEARALVIQAASRPDLLRKLILDGFFDKPVSSKEVVHRIREKFGKKWETNWVQTNIRKFMDAGIIHGIRLAGASSNFWAISSISREEASRLIRKDEKARKTAGDLFSPALMGRLSRDFKDELDELSDNYNKNGNSTAFLLRKILEKLIIIVFSKNSKEHLLEDAKRPGGWIGLEKMIDIASKEKLGGIPFLIPSTARKISGIKFLGDTAAHNPLASVDMSAITPQMPYIITAYEELSKRL